MRNLLSGMRRHKLAVLSGGTVLLVAFVVVGLAVASNMGFKLNFGIVNALNRLLNGSGVSFSQNVGEEGNAVLEVNLDLENPNLPPQNSNMGFKLNVMSVPDGGLEVVLETGGTLFILPGGTFSYKPPE